MPQLFLLLWKPRKTGVHTILLMSRGSAGIRPVGESKKNIKNTESHRKCVIKKAFAIEISKQDCFYGERSYYFPLLFFVYHQDALHQHENCKKKNVWQRGKNGSERETGMWIDAYFITASLIRCNKAYEKLHLKA